jgi:hypothetical protein
MLSLSSVSSTYLPRKIWIPFRNRGCAISQLTQFWNKGWIYFCDSNKEWLNCAFPFKLSF